MSVSKRLQMFDHSDSWFIKIGKNVVASATYSRRVPKCLERRSRRCEKKSKNLNMSDSGAVEGAVGRSHSHHSCCAISSWMFLQHTSNRPYTSRLLVFEYQHYVSNLSTFNGGTISFQWGRFIMKEGRHSFFNRFHRWFIICCTWVYLL